jgi:hypothetical protein
VSRAQLVNLKNAISTSLTVTTDQNTRYHLQEAVVRIDAILDPK